MLERLSVDYGKKSKISFTVPSLKGSATRSKKLLVAPGLTTSHKKLLGPFVITLPIETLDTKSSPHDLM